MSKHQQELAIQCEFKPDGNHLQDIIAEALSIFIETRFEKQIHMIHDPTK